MVVEVKKVNNLTDIEVKEVSVVRFGANNKRFNLIKDKDGLTEKPFWMTQKEFNDLKLGDGKNMADGVKSDVDIAKEAAEKAAELLRKETEEKNRIAEEARLAKEAKEATEKLLKETANDKEALAKELQSTRDALNKSNDRITTVENIAKEERNARILTDKVVFAKENLGFVGSDRVLGEMIKEAEEVLKPETFKTFMETLKSANEKIKSGGVFTELGKDSTSTAKGYDRLNQVAKSIMETDKVDYSTAVSLAISRDNTLYKEYEASIKNTGE